MKWTVKRKDSSLDLNVPRVSTRLLCEGREFHALATK